MTLIFITVFRTQKNEVSAPPILIDICMIQDLAKHTFRLIFVRPDNV